MDRQKIFQRQKTLRAQLRDRPLVHAAVSPDKAASLLDCEVDEARLRSFDYAAELTFPLKADAAEVQSLLSELKGAFDRGRLEDFLGKAQKDVLHSIAAPFGLGKVLSAYDKEGGNVDTIHNARQGIYATEREKVAYENRGEYDTYAVHSHETYKEENRKHSINRKTVGDRDTYSGDIRGAHDNVDLDHVISGRQTHDDAGRVLAEVRTEDLANIKENLAATHRTINRSKRDKSPEEFAQYLEESSAARKAKIAELSARGDLSEEEKKDLEKLKNLDSADPDAIRERGKQAQSAQDKILNRKYYTSEKFWTDAASTGVTEGTKLGVQQAFGVMLIELFAGVFSELRSAFRDGLQGETLFDDVKIRLKRIAQSVAARWKDAVTGFGAGFISGFISNLVTTIINAFVTTGRRAVRMIREGIFSLLKALKMMLFPPEGMTFREAAHEALKLMAAGGIVIAGVALEEVIEKLIASVPILAPAAPILTAVVVGSLSAIGMALTAYLIDKLDLFGVIKVQRDTYVIQILDTDIQIQLEACERIAAQVEDMLALPVPTT